MAESASPFTLLDLLHPHGGGGPACLIGSGCPPNLQPPAERLLPAPAPAQLVLIAPSAQEAAQPGWLEQALTQALDRLAPDGLVYALLPPPLRRKARTNLRRGGLRTAWVAHFPDWASGRYLLPLEARLVDYAFENVMPTSVLKRKLVVFGLRLPGGAEDVALRLPGAALVAVRKTPGAPAAPVFGWILHHPALEAGQQGRARLAVSAGASMPAARKREGKPVVAPVLLVASPRRAGGSAVLLPLPGDGDRPEVIAKLCWGQESREPELLASLGPCAEQAGARLPRWLGSQPVTGRKTIAPGAPAASFYTALAGQSAATWLKDHPERLEPVLVPLAKWLARWNALTITRRPLQADFYETQVFAALTCVWSRLPEPEAYAAFLRGLVARLDGPIPLVAAHHDLTMWNVLLEDLPRSVDASPPPAPGIIDWETAAPLALPFTDLFYALVDAVALCAPDPHPPARQRALALVSCLSPQPKPGGAQPWPAQVARRCLALLVDALQPPPGLLDLSLHACFLHHAANEFQANLGTPIWAAPGAPAEGQPVCEDRRLETASGGGEGDAPFLNCVRWLARSRFTFTDGGTA